MLQCPNMASSTLLPRPLCSWAHWAITGWTGETGWLVSRERVSYPFGYYNSLLLRRHFADLSRGAPLHLSAHSERSIHTILSQTSSSLSFQSCFFQSLNLQPNHFATTNQYTVQQANCWPEYCLSSLIPEEDSEHLPTAPWYWNQQEHNTLKHRIEQHLTELYLHREETEQDQFQ